MGDLARLLDRVRAAVAPLDKPTLPAEPAPGRPGLAGADRETWIATLAARLDELRAPGDTAPGLRRVADASAAAAVLRELIADADRGDVLWPGDRAARRDYRVGITPAVAMIAETGSAVLDLAGIEAAWASLAVDTHVVLAFAGDVVPDLVTFYAGHAPRIGAALGRYQVQVTGASRTADVEKIVVVPAHGPQRLVVVLGDVRVDLTALRTAVTA